MERRLLTLKEAAAYLGVSVRHFTGSLLPLFPVIDLARPGKGRRVPRVDVADLDRWVDQQKGAA